MASSFDRFIEMALPVPAASQPPKLLDRMRNHLRMRHYSIRTETAYVDWARRFILFHGKRHPQEMSAAEVEAFLTHLAVQRQVPRLPKIRPRPGFCIFTKGCGKWS